VVVEGIELASKLGKLLGITHAPWSAVVEARKTSGQN
jgi:hypothetical protein